MPAILFVCIFRGKILCLFQTAFPIVLDNHRKLRSALKTADLYVDQKIAHIASFQHHFFRPSPEQQQIHCHAAVGDFQLGVRSAGQWQDTLQNRVANGKYRHRIAFAKRCQCLQSGDVLHGDLLRHQQLIRLQCQNRHDRIGLLGVLLYRLPESLYMLGRQRKSACTGVTAIA